LQATLSPQEKARVETKRQLTRRVRSLFARRAIIKRDQTTAQDFNGDQIFTNQAIKLDPSFLLPTRGSRRRQAIFTTSTNHRGMEAKGVSEALDSLRLSRTSAKGTWLSGFTILLHGK